MKIELDSIDGSAMDYRVVLCEDDEDSTEGQELGFTRRSGGDEWAFYSTKLMGNDGTTTDEPQFTVTAATLDELRAGLGKRFSAIDLRADRLQNKTMERYAEHTLHNLRELADGTNSTAGYVAALADAVAHSMVEDFGKAIPATLTLFNDQVVKCIAKRQLEKKMEKEVQGKLGELFGAIIKKRSEADDAPTKH